jgi:hypothetical protein
MGLEKEKRVYLKRKAMNKMNHTIIKLRVWHNDTKHMEYLPPLTTKGLNRNCSRTINWVGGQDLIFMLFTNQFDKNGKEDWINDIVKVKVGQETYFRKIFQAESGAYCIDLPVFNSTSGEEGIMICSIEHENVGNIYENFNLLNK